MAEARMPTPVDDVAEQYVDGWVELNPIEATFAGLLGQDDRLPDFTPGWWQSMSEHRRQTLAALQAAEPVDATDRTTVAAMRDEFSVREDLHAIGADESLLDVISSPVQSIRDVFDLTPTNTVDEWTTVVKRLRAVPTAVDGYVESLRFAAERGHTRARRQVTGCVQQCDDNIGPDGFFARFASEAMTADGAVLPEALRKDLRSAALVASEAYERLQTFLHEELLPQAREADAFGREQYEIYSRAFVGTRIDIDETYEWGQAELARITADMAATADRIKPGATVAEAISHLAQIGSHSLIGTEALQAWMQEKSDAAIAALADTYFDIPVAIRTLECRIAPTHQGGIYYTGPSEDLVTRPGRMWWSVPKGITEFSTWRELTTVYHEGVPGHHLQIAQTSYRRESLNRWRRLASWVSGHGEGWALYAERLMADLGFLDDPAYYLGMLDGQSMRAARVVLDIGVHCGLPAPAEVGGGEWTYDKAWRFLGSHANMAEGFLRFELDRYLGWPGQAPSYKLGERFWLQLREDAKARAGASFDLNSFHRTALDIGSVGLDVLRAAVLNEI